MRQPTYILKINNPCSQDWNSMNKVECGRFCSECSKSVIDFSSLTDKAVFKIINQASGKICGRLTADQLNRKITVQSTNNSFSFSKFFAGLLLLGLSKTNATFGRDIKKSIEFVNTNSSNRITVYEKSIIDTTLNVIKGKVIDGRTKEHLQGAAVILKGTKTGVPTDVEGNFSLKIPDSLLTAKVVLVVSYVGYSTKEFTILRVDIGTSKEFVLSQMEQALTGEVIIIKRKKWWQFWK